MKVREYSKALSFVAVSLLALASVFMSSAAFVEAQQGEKFFLVPRWSHIVLEAGEKVTIPATAENKGVRAVEFSVSWTKTPGVDWGTWIRGALTNFEVKGVAMPPGDTRSLSLEVKAPDDVQAGTYDFELRAASVDGLWERLLPITVTIEPEEVVPQSLFPPGQLFLQPPRFSSLTGGNDGVFEYSLGLRNLTEQRANLELTAVVPQGWNVGFFPSYERDKRIISVSIDAGAAATVTVVVTPASNAEPGRYDIEFTASGGEKDLTTDFVVDLTGARALRLGAPDGRLNTVGSPGGLAEMTMTVTNSGGAPLEFINVAGQAPDGWDLEFDPATLNFLEPGDVREVRLNIQTAQEAIPGDYRLTVAALGQGVGDQVDIVVTVTQSTIWGWVGLGGVVIVLGAMAGLFLRLGRR